MGPPATINFACDKSVVQARKSFPRHDRCERRFRAQTSTTPLGIIEISWHSISLRMGMPNCYDPQSPRRIDETRRSRFLLLGCCSLLRCNNRAAFLLRCSRPCLFLRRLLLRRLWRFVAHMLKLPSLAWQTRALNRPTFGIARLTFTPQHCLTINYTCKRITIGKTKLSVRKAEERH
jgi:hypothetical protein